MDECPRCKEVTETSIQIQKRATERVNFCEARMYHSWKALRSQSKGMNRMARRIKKLRIEITELQGEIKRLRITKV